MALMLFAAGGIGLILAIRGTFAAEVAGCQVEIGAAGAMEAGFCWLALRHAAGGELSLPPHVYDGRFDPALASVPLATKGMRVPVAAVMTNSFGFGGNNCTLVLARGST